MSYCNSLILWCDSQKIKLRKLTLAQLQSLSRKIKIIKKKTQLLNFLVLITEVILSTIQNSYKGVCVEKLTKI